MDALRRQLGLCCGLAILLLMGCRSPLGFVAKTATHNVVNTPADPMVAASHGANGVSKAGYASDPSQSANANPQSQGPLATPTREEAFTQILDDLESLGVENPAAQRELLAQLKQADPDHWDLLVRRFQADLAYNRQVKGVDSYDTNRDGVMVAQRESAAGPNPGRRTAKRQPAEEDEPRVARAVTTADRTTDRNRPDRPDESSTYPNTREPKAFDKMRRDERREFAPRDDDSYESSYEPSSKDSYGREEDRRSASRDVGRRDERVQRVSANLVSEADRSYGRPHERAERSVYGQRDQRRWKAALQDAIEDLQRDLVAQPESTREAYQHARLRLLQLVAGDLDQASRHVPGLTPTEQDYWAKQLYAIDALLDVDRQPEPGRRAGAASMHLSSAQAKLSQLSSLSIRNAAFCEKIYGYGAYDVRKENKFRPGESVSIYAEVENFRSVSTEEGYQTVIGTSYRVLDQRGNRVDGREFPRIEDFCLSRRRDFNLQYEMKLPERIYPDEYQFELTLTDHLGQKIGRTTLDFTIVEGDVAE